MKQVFMSKNAQNLCAFAKEKYGDELEFLWQKFSKNAILRKKKTKKWYAAFCVVSKAQLGMDDSKKECVEIVNLKLDPQDVLAFVDNQKCFKAYHMNKKHWISILLSGNDTLEFEQMCRFLEQSYALA
ncbi:MmcQ/YjbR family DNA-binding protein [Helicobacter sp. MIT 05-5293]|uniref:MmcQ/YjbR family DNA-binding protein n=1 Tax=Helicobacter sp. MIT 05-5293 TaxID=1548149 RepID=UPI00068C015B|nr:MmcQ/YjbR family DNA-binding protein [Helicobacter sp. MIT 05-5293]